MSNADKTALCILNEALDEMCDNYCKYPAEYFAEYKDPQDAMDAMMIERCYSCPLNRIR